MEAPKLEKLTIQEYVAIEQKTDTKHEYHDGYISMIKRGSLNHAYIGGNIFSNLRNALTSKSNNYIVLNSQVKLHIAAGNRILYPVSMVIHGKIQRSKIEREALVNPIVIVEVLSKTTSAYDRGKKFSYYRQIPTLQEYILIEEEEPMVEIYSDKKYFWQVKWIEGLTKSLYIPTLEISIPMADIYRDIEFPDSPQR